LGPYLNCLPRLFVLNVSFRPGFPYRWSSHFIVYVCVCVCVCVCERESVCERERERDSCNASSASDSGVDGGWLTNRSQTRVRLTV